MKEEKAAVDRECLLKKWPGKGGWTYAEIPEIPQDRKAPFGWVTVKGWIDDYELKLPIADLKHRLKKFKAIVDYHGIREVLEVHSSNKIIMSDKLAKLITPIIHKTLSHTYQ